MPSGSLKISSNSICMETPKWLGLELRACQLHVYRRLLASLLSDLTEMVNRGYLRTVQNESYCCLPYLFLHPQACRTTTVATWRVLASLVLSGARKSRARA